MVKTGGLDVCTDQNALYTKFLPSPRRKETNMPKIKTNQGLTVVIYTVISGMF